MVGTFVGVSVGEVVGVILGKVVGVPVGPSVGLLLVGEEFFVGSNVLTVIVEGTSAGARVGVWEGEFSLHFVLGSAVGHFVGLHFVVGIESGVNEACTVTFPSSSNSLSSGISVFAATEVLHSAATTSGRNTFIFWSRELRNYLSQIIT